MPSIDKMMSVNDATMTSWPADGKGGSSILKPSPGSFAPLEVSVRGSSSTEAPARGEGVDSGWSSANGVRTPELSNGEGLPSLYCSP